MEVDVQVERAAEALNQGDRAGLGALAGKPSLPRQVGGDAAVDDGEHLAHDGRVAREQKPQGVSRRVKFRVLGLTGKSCCDCCYPVGESGKAQVPSEEVSHRACSEPVCISRKGVYEARCSECVGRVIELRKAYCCGPEG